MTVLGFTMPLMPGASSRVRIDGLRSVGRILQISGMVFRGSPSGPGLSIAQYPIVHGRFPSYPEKRHVLQVPADPTGLIIAHMVDMGFGMELGIELENMAGVELLDIRVELMPEDRRPALRKRVARRERKLLQAQARLDEARSALAAMEREWGRT